MSLKVNKLRNSHKKSSFSRSVSKLAGERVQRMSVLGHVDYREMEKLEDHTYDYTQQYLRQNKLYTYLKGFTALDNIINLFFLNYANLDRSSVNCARLWAAVMRARTQAVNAVTHLFDQQRFLTFHYRKARLEELHRHIYPLRNTVARAVQFIAMFLKHKDEEWRFLRKGFLDMHSRTIAKDLTIAVNNWMEFILTSFEVQKGTSEAYREHLKLQDEKAKQSMLLVEPKSKVGKGNEMHLRIMVEETKKEPKEGDDFMRLRIAFNSVLDAYSTSAILVENPLDFTVSKTKPGGVLMDYQVLLHSAIAFVKTEFGDEMVKELLSSARMKLAAHLPDQVLIDDDRVWGHQLGIMDLGPFAMVPLREPADFVNVTEGEGGEPGKWCLRDEVADIKGLSVFFKATGSVTQRTEITFSKDELKMFELKEKVSSFSFFFPLDVSLGEGGVESADLGAFINMQSPLHLLASIGGFGYFSKDGRLIAMRTLALGDDFFFDGPYKAKHGAFKRFKEQRIVSKPVTLQGLIDVGVREFAWVHPGQRELIVDETSAAKINWKFRGAFAYNYDFEKTALAIQYSPCYFQVLTFDEMNLKTQDTLNSPIIVNIMDLYDKYKEAWEDQDLYQELIAAEETAGVNLEETVATIEAATQNYMESKQDFHQFSNKKAKTRKRNKKKAKAARALKSAHRKASQFADHVGAADLKRGMEKLRRKAPVLGDLTTPDSDSLRGLLASSHKQHRFA